jgi:hypothetical protein
MRFLKLKWILFAGATLGLLVPMAFLLRTEYGHYLFGSTLDLCLFPSSIMLMATENHGHDLFALGILAYSLFLNILYYSIIATLLWCIARVIAAAISWLRTRRCNL